jgi:hypothetical protein
MIADYMTKPLQGAMFKKFHDLIMGISPVHVLKELIQEEKLNPRRRSSTTGVCWIPMMNLRESTRVTANTYMSPRCDRLINKYEGG